MLKMLTGHTFFNIQSYIRKKFAMERWFNHPNYSINEKHWQNFGVKRNIF